MASSRFSALIRRINLYPPFLGMGIRVRDRNDGFTRFVVELRERWYTRNLFGTHFGGSLYTMTDPFFVFIVTVNFGKAYIVWDKSAAIEFLRPASGTVTAVFEIDVERLAAMRAEVDSLGKQTFEFVVPIKNVEGVTVARVTKEIYVRSKASSR